MIWYFDNAQPVSQGCKDCQATNVVRVASRCCIHWPRPHDLLRWVTKHSDFHNHVDEKIPLHQQKYGKIVWPCLTSRIQGSYKTHLLHHPKGTAHWKVNLGHPSTVMSGRWVDTFDLRHLLWRSPGTRDLCSVQEIALFLQPSRFQPAKMVDEFKV